MRVSNASHESIAWRIGEIAPDFTLEDVWALPVYGRAEDFEALLETVASFDPASASSLPVRALFQFRWQLGRWFGWDGAEDAQPIPGSSDTSLTQRLPEDLRNTVSDLRFAHLPFAPLYRTDVEFAAEVSNVTVHGLVHLAWVHRGNGRYQGQMAVYVKPRGSLGKGYLALIKPFRLWVVYPALLRQIERAWTTRNFANRPRPA
jgi:hypothetical protein